jgi:hypothetical protein
MEKSELTTYSQEVAEKLGETEEIPINQIQSIIEHAGRDFVETMLAETMLIEEQGGMQTENNKRRRTPGGVFFYIVKGKLDIEVRQQIFPNFGQAEKRPVLEWDERRQHVDSLLEHEAQGEIRYVTIILHGRPNEVIIKGDTVIATLNHQHHQTPLPRGVPHPPEKATPYTVYMARKYWEEVTEFLEKYKSDRLIVEGTLFWDAETQTVAVFAAKVTTRRIEKIARKETQQQEQEQKSDKKLAPPSKPTSTNAASSIKLPDGIPSDVAVKLRQLYNAAETLRERIKDMETKGQAGVSMTKKLLHNTEKQIEALEKQYKS